MPALDILGLIPLSFQAQLLGTLVDFVSSLAAEALGSRAASKIAGLESDARFRRAFEEGLQRAADRYVQEYEMEDEDLVAAIAADQSFLRNEQVQAALLAIIREPGRYLADERETVLRSFETVLPARKNRDRVDRAVSAFLKCLAEELWTLPELQGIYALQFQKMTAEATRQQVALQKAQLEATLGLSADLRQTLVELTDAVGQRKLLPGPETPALPAPPRVDHNLPQPDYGDFVGREDELARIYRLLRPYPHSQEHLVSIDGIGGIGKSALALKVAHHYLRGVDRLPPEERFEAIIWISAKSSVLTADGTVPRRQIARTLEDIYAVLSVVLEREHITRAESGERDVRVTRALAQQRTLLVLDNLETVDDERVNAFLRELPAPTKCVVTTRHRIDVATPVRLTEMSRAEGLKLIAGECARKGVALAEPKAQALYERTGGVPLAMVWSVAQIGYGYGVETVLHRLGQPTEDINRFCFEGAMACIRGTHAHRLLLALSLYAVDASREALGYVAGLDQDLLGRDEGLVTLERLALVNKRGDRFRMLPPTHRYTTSELAQAEDREGLVQRWIDYYVRRSAEYGGEHWNWTNYDWLLAEGENILALADWAMGSDHLETVLRLHYPIMRYLDIEGRWVELNEYGERSYEIAQSLNELRVQAWICTHWMGYFYTEQGIYERPERLLREGIALYRRLADEKGVTLALGVLSRVLRRKGQFEASRRMAQEALRLAQEIDYEDGTAAAYDQMGKIARDLERWPEAKAHFEETRRLCEKEGFGIDVSFLMNVLGNLGWVEAKLGDYEHGKELCETSLAFFKRMGGRGYTTSIQCRLAAIEMALGHDDQGRQYAQEALFWAERLQTPRELRDARALLGLAPREGALPDEAGGGADREATDRMGG
jgi:LuxR family glucitol operon transcriptional activator